MIQEAKQVKEYRILSLHERDLSTVHAETSAKAAAEYYGIDPMHVLRIDGTGKRETFARYANPDSIEDSPLVEYIDIEEVTA